MEYLESYANHFNLHPYIKFNTKVINIDFVIQEGQDMLSWSHCWGGADQAFSSPTKDDLVYEVEFVILCVGRFSGVPNIPDFPPNRGPDAFIRGKVVHSMDYSAMNDCDAAEFVKGKRVAVVGSLKSALDIANECAIANEITGHWYLPDNHPWGVSLGSLYLNRCAELMVHKPGEGLILGLLATLLSPLRWAASKFVESYIKSKFPLKKHNMVPEHSLSQELSSCLVARVPERFYERVEEGSIILRKSNGFSFSKDGLIFDDDAGALLETDAVILATGYKGDENLKNIFKSPIFQRCIMGSSNSTVPLYRYDQTNVVPICSQDSIYFSI
ncbi:hypothetical protein MKX03_028072 [Papaver bracteatum]|nr:hypothetical protein MKX03_028072 [Papaver bracteatum]